MKVYGYIRVSTDKQDTENQKLGVSTKADALDLKISVWISDDGVSGTKEPEDRKLGGLLKKINSGDVIITSELSRLGRSLFMVMRILEHCMKVGAKVYTVKDGYELGDNIQSKVLAFAFALAAEIERDMISKRTKEALARRKLEGVILGRKKGSKSCIVKLTGKEKKIKMLLSKGVSVSAIGRLLNVHRYTVSQYIKDMKNGTVEKRATLAKKVFQYDCHSGQLIMEFQTIADIEKKTGLYRSSVQRCLNGETPTAYDCFWSYEHSDNYFEMKSHIHGTDARALEV